MKYKNSIFIVAIATIITLGATIAFTYVPPKPTDSVIIETLAMNNRFSVDIMKRTKEEVVGSDLAKVWFSAEGKCKRDLEGLCKTGESVIFGRAEDDKTIDGWIVFKKTKAGWMKQEGNTWPLKKQ